LLLLGEAPKEESVVVGPSVVFEFQHATFPPVVIVGVIKLASIELFHAVEMTVENSD